MGHFQAKIESKVYDTAPVNINEVVDRDEAVHDLEKIKNEYGYQSSNVFHLNGDIAISMESGRTRIIGFFKR